MEDLFKSLRQIRSNNDTSRAIILYEKYQTYNLSTKKIEELYNLYLSLINSNFDKFNLEFKRKFYENLLSYEFKLESTYSQIVKFMALNNKLDESLEYLTKFKEKNIIIKRRTIQPIIELSDNTNRTNVLTKLLDIIQSNNIKIESLEYSHLLSLAKFSPKVYDKIFDSMSINVIPNTMIHCLKIRYSNHKISDCEIIDHHCSNCNFELKSIVLSKIESLQLQTELQSFVKSFNNSHLFDKYIKKIKRNNVSVVIDGANIGYYNQRPDLGGRISFKQIDSMANYFIKIRKKPLIFLNVRHLTNTVSYLENQIIDSWTKKGILYITPKGLNDDWYWLYFSIKLMDEIDDSLLITNDNMCDHIFQIFTRSIFNKWKERVLTKYEFEKLIPKLDIPSSYSIKKQCNELYIHLPYSELGIIKWLCISV